MFCHAGYNLNAEKESLNRGWFNQQQVTPEEVWLIFGDRHHADPSLMQKQMLKAICPFANKNKKFIASEYQKLLSHVLLWKELSFSFIILTVLFNFSV